MRSYQVLCLLLVALCYSEAKLILKRHGPPEDSPPDSRAVKPWWGIIDMRLDHFDPTDNRTWEMRFLNNSQFFKPGGPMFIFLGGEWTISTGRLMSGQMFDMASEHNGYMFYTEHRFYGKSYPIEDLKTSSLKYLSTDQALADVIYFIEQKKKDIPGLENSKVVVVGASYSAAMATWLRMKFPHIVTAALASSGPLYPVEDFYEYFEVINDNIKLNSGACLETLREGTAEMVRMLETPEGITKLSEMMNTCERIETKEPHRSFFFNTMADIFGGLVQYASVGQINFECRKLLTFGGHAIDKLTAYVRSYYGKYCMGGYNEFLENFGGTEMTTSIYRQWTYQTCTEYGYFQGTTSDNQPFGKTFPIEFCHHMCKDLFGEEFTPELIRRGINRTNIMFGALDLDVTQVVSVHGTVDPWHAKGLLHDLSPLAPAFLVNGTSHCADLNAISENDLPQMYEVKKRSKELIAEWLK